MGQGGGPREGVLEIRESQTFLAQAFEQRVRVSTCVLESELKLYMRMASGIGKEVVPSTNTDGAVSFRQGQHTYI